MLFSSAQFLLVFLPITALLFALAARYASVGLALGVLTVASIAFYAAWRPWGVPLLMGSIVGNWLVSTRCDARRPGGRWALAAGVVGNLALLFWFKYAFFASTVAVDAGLMDHPLARRALPLGISFFTFVQIAYLVDRYRGLAPVAGFWRYVLFVSFFPHLIAGPIVHHAAVMPQLDHPRPDWPTFALAMFIFAVGLAKKTLIADPLGGAADAAFAPGAVRSLATLNAWGAVLAYTLQLYFDFSGYSDMAVGLALMFGVRFPWNFLSPYRATSIARFWRTWHVTLSNFLRDYVYIPLGGSRVGRVRASANLLITMLVGGIWHGAGWTYVLWGGLHGGALVVNHRWAALQRRLPALVAWGLTIVVVGLGWVLFRAETLSDATAVYRAMLGLGHHGLASDDRGLLAVVPYLLMGLVIALAMPNTRQLSQWFRPNVVWATATGGLMCVALAFVLGRVSPPEFIYYAF
jgi:alginate O-acetyltransferase complex protein AlgI